MRLFPLLILAAGYDATVLTWMHHAFYPVLLGILVIASLGLPIPEDVPLIAAGMILATSPETASWSGTLVVAMVGIMTGDLVLYSAGKRWGRDVVNHRWVRSLITPARFDRMVDYFHRYGTWMCFFGRFFMGIRAVMCITAGATRFPYWRFFIADFAGALLSIPFFVWLGWKFGQMLPQMKAWLGRAQIGVLIVVGVGVAAFVWYEVRRARRSRAQCRAARVADAETGARPGVRATPAVPPAPRAAQRVS